MNKENVIYVQNGIILSLREEESPITGNSVCEPGGTTSKVNTEGQVPHDCMHF